MITRRSAADVIEAADLVIAFPGKGRGTWNTIYLAEERNPGRCLPNQVIRL
jgi:hypothetical protein